MLKNQVPAPLSHYTYEDRNVKTFHEQIPTFEEDKLLATNWNQWLRAAQPSHISTDVKDLNNEVDDLDLPRPERETLPDFKKVEATMVITGDNFWRAQ